MSNAAAIDAGVREIREQRGRDTVDLDRLHVPRVDLGTVGDERRRGRPAHARRGAGDDRSLAVVVPGHRECSMWSGIQVAVRSQNRSPNRVM